MPFDPHVATRALLDSRLSNTRLAGLPEAGRPQTEAEAIIVQNLVAQALGPVAAWKVGSATIESEPFRAPIHADTLFEAVDRVPAAMFHVIGVEAEIAYRFGRDLDPADGPFSREQVLDAVASLHPAIEIVDTRYERYGALDPLSHRADQGNHGALIVGPALDDWRGLDPVRLPVELTIDARVAAQAVGGNSAVDPVRLLVWLANTGSRSLGGLRSGQVVTTGSCTGTIFVDPGARVRAAFAGLGQIALTID